MRHKGWLSRLLLLVCAFWLTPMLRGQDCDNLLSTTTNPIGRAV
jgi:hypothetical protein